MNNDISIPYHEIDFLLPVHRFNIRYSYVTKKSLPFIREFVLRLLHLAPMQPSQIASYFGLSKREANEALSDLVESEDLVFNDNGTVSLTNQSQGYFTGLGTIPQVSADVEHNGVFSFELASFQCIGTKRQQHGKWNNGLVLNASLENVANSEKLAKKHFQSQFYKMLDDEVISINYDESGGRPSIYKMESVKKIGQEPLRINQTFSIDKNGSPLERADIDQFDDATEIQGLITSAIYEMPNKNNIKEIILAIDAIGDEYTGALVGENGVDLIQLLNHIVSQDSVNKNAVTFLGPVYSSANWAKLLGYLNPILTKMEKEHLDGVDEFIWIAPSDAFWGKSAKFSDCFGDLVGRAATKGKNSKRLFIPKMYVPLADAEDRYGKQNWSRDLIDSIQHVYGLVEGFLGGHVEIILLPGRFVMVCYHISTLENFPVTLPLGFMSTEVDMIKKIHISLRSYIDGSAESKDLGAISKL
jgi:hypothetical protein